MGSEPVTHPLLISVHMTTTSKKRDYSNDRVDRPREEFQAPTPIVIAGRKHPEKNGSTDGEERETPSMPPPATPSDTRKSTTNDDDNNDHDTAALAAGKGSGVILPPPPPRKEKAGAGQGGGSGGGRYVPPSWGLTTAPTSTELSLTVLKGGTEVGSISLDSQPYFLLGRQQGVVDILLEHPSISRKHAILQHGDKGSLFLLDNGSTHGCRVNKEKIPPKEFHRVHVGNVIKFGESTRLYVVEGPEELRPAEYESENLRNLRLEAGRKQLAVKLAKIKAGGGGGGVGGGDSGEYGISWGFDEDAVDEDEEDDEAADDEDGADGEVELPDYLKTEAQKRRRHDTRTGLKEDNVHKRDAKLFEKLQVKLTKVEHLLTENERIAVKEGAQGGLTEGQQAQLARNDKAIATIRLQIEELEDTIRSKNKARERSKGDDGGNDGDKSGGRTGGEDKEDDYYDRTAPLGSASSRTPGGALSKKAEVRTRRFARKDKNAKNLVVVPRADVGSSSAMLADGVGGAFSSGDDAQSLEVLRRRAETVAGDLEKTEAGLAELEAEEAEENEEGEKPPEEGAAADPLDEFMTSNRRNERQQAITRLSAQRDSLKTEQECIGVMIEAATPSMPTLKPVANTSLNESTETTVPEKSPPLTERAEPMSASEEVKGEEPVTCDGSASAFAADSDGSHGGVASDDDPGERACRSSPNIASTTSPASACRSLVSGETAVGKQKIERDREDENRWEQSAGGRKRRGTPIEATMLPPPPPAKRSEHVGKENAALEAMEEKGVSHQQCEGTAARRTIKGPAAMPAPSVKPSRSSAGGYVRREVPAEDVKERGEGSVDPREEEDSHVEGKVVLEGGDADWVPPKGQVGDGRTALNAKFGY